MVAFFMVNSRASYNALLGRDWIHTSWCILLTLYQFLIFWNGNEVEVVWVDNKPFVAKIRYLEVMLYEDDIGPVKLNRRDKNEKPMVTTMVKQQENQIIQVYRQLDQPLVVITPIDEDDTPNVVNRPELIIEKV